MPDATLTVKLFASLAETRGWRERSLALPTEATVLGAWRAVTGEDTLPPRVFCARNMDYCAPETPIKAGDEVAFFPAVTGGAQ